MKIINGNILSGTTECHTKRIIVCQQVNCKGVMGAGLAKQIRTMFPNVYPTYKAYCNKYGANLLGYVHLYGIPKTYNIIANLFGQDGYGRDKRYTDYDALRECFRRLRRLTDSTYTIRIPYNMGCGLAGGDWDIVTKIIEEELIKYNCDVEIYKLK